MSNSSEHTTAITNTSFTCSDSSDYVFRYELTCKLFSLEKAQHLVT